MYYFLNNIPKKHQLLSFIIYYSCQASVFPNLCCDQTESRSIHLPDTLIQVNPLGLPWCLIGKEFTCQCKRRDSDLIPVSQSSSGKGNGDPLQFSCLGKPMDRGAWQATVHGGHKRVRHDLKSKQQQQQHCFY